MIEMVYSQGADAPVDGHVKAALVLIEKFTLHPDALGPDDIRAARSAGLTDQAIEDVFHVATIFVIFNRLSDAFGFHVRKRLIQKGAPLVLRFGYRFLTFA